jgi:hypothetical protein
MMVTIRSISKDRSDTEDRGRVDQHEDKLGPGHKQGARDEDRHRYEGRSQVFVDQKERPDACQDDGE